MGRVVGRVVLSILIFDFEIVRCLSVFLEGVGVIGWGLGYR